MEYSCHSPEEKHWFIGRVTRFAGGGPVRVVVAHEEISERKQAEVALQRSERNLADFFEHAVIGLHWVGPDGVILRANQAELELLGYSREEYIGHNISEFHVEQAEVEDRLKRLANQETLNNYEARLRAKDGSIRHVLISSNVLWENGEFIHTRCFTRDITDRKFLEGQVLQISEREQQRIGQDIHDELCQHLTGIKYKISLLARKLERQFAEEARDTKAIAQLLDRAIDQAYSLARGLNPVKVESAGLQSALEELTANMESVFPVTCSFGISGRPVNVEDSAMAIHLYRIAQEAITNAIKHGKAGHVRVHLKAGTTGEGVTLTVEDDGIGIQREGTHRSGMGLHSMNYRARMIGAVLDIQRVSDAGGTRVTCVLPRLPG
jgi:PAS domain S-box-containing protein